ncbi:uncharacterized protein IL334_005098 [Kwoniella shivajii]|uniref:Uncharacterized protein n=1 Tax=Kwoniella shivajii TaxID=564305 RepID=A0ABZ1D280_9TREE|nr:hypothetical protein IL334_005098 [Kwoniella shivajii]
MVLTLELVNGAHDDVAWTNLRSEIVEVINFCRSLASTSAIVTRGISLLEGMVTEAETRHSTAVAARSGLDQPISVFSDPFTFTSDDMWTAGIMNYLDPDLYNIFFGPDVTLS